MMKRLVAKVLRKTANRLDPPRNYGFNAANGTSTTGNYRLTFLR